MTVREAIEELGKLPPDAVLFVNDGDDGWGEADVAGSLLMVELQGETAVTRKVFTRWMPKKEYEGWEHKETETVLREVQGVFVG